MFASERWKIQLLTLFVRGMSKATKPRTAGAKKVRKSKQPFMDSLRIYVRAGAGGQGLPRFGGVGGDGGSVVAIADKQQTLPRLRDQNPVKRYVAGGGKSSKKLVLLGEKGSDIDILVPVGVSMMTDDGKTIGELNEEGQTVVLAQGGRGGNPNNSFLGQKGESRNVTLDLKLIADIGLVGFPNAGKSTFLKAISRASPKIASYPFTTIRPQIGVMEYQDFRKISVADLPGLIEGAHLNFGMGHKFLKHVERTKALLFLVDVFGFQLRHDYPERSAFQTILLLIKELELYDEAVAGKPAVLAFNKLDVAGSEAKLAEVTGLLQDLPKSLESVDPAFHPESLPRFEAVVPISAQKGSGVSELKDKLRALLDSLDDEARLQRNLDDNSTQAGIPSAFQEHARKKLV